MHPKSYPKTSNDDYNTLITEDYILKDENGKNIIVYKKIDIDFSLINSQVVILPETKLRTIRHPLEEYYNTINKYVTEYFPDKSLIGNVYYNINAALGYHTDIINADNSITVTLCYKENVKGGYLVFPDFKLAVEQEHSYICMFDGKTVKHGVTEIIKTEPEGKRITYIFFT